MCIVKFIFDFANQIYTLEYTVKFRFDFIVVAFLQFLCLFQNSYKCYIIHSEGHVQFAGWEIMLACILFSCFLSLH